MLISLRRSFGLSQISRAIAHLRVRRDVTVDTGERYLGLRVVADAAARLEPDAADAAAAAARLRRAEASVGDALGHLDPLRATTEIRRLRRTLAEARAAVGRCATAAADLRLGELRAGEAVVLGFHPHGIIPFNTGLMLYGRDWRDTIAATLPRTVVCTDAFTHVVPWMRDLGQWLGMRECTRSCVGATLDGGASVVLVPGGQAEIFATKSWGTAVAVYRGHRGFVRLALEHRARLVPVFSFGEWELMDNVYFPTLQRATRAFLGFPLPFWPYGLFGLPLPRKPPRGVTIVVGRPLEIHVDGAVDDAAVDACHAKYFAALHDLFERHKASAGYPNHVLAFDDGPGPRRGKAKAR